MDRNWDIIREILIKLKEKPPEERNIDLEIFPEDKAHEVSYHVELLLDAGLIKGNIFDDVYGPEPKDFSISGMTWQGHELLDSIQNQKIWEKVKSRFSKVSGAMTIDLVKLVAREYTKELLNL